MFDRKQCDIKPFENKVWLSSPTMHGEEIEYVKEYVRNIGGVDALVSKLKQSQRIESQQAALQASVEETVYVPAEVPDGTGHLYPVALVTEWTNKLNFYNAMLDDFIKKIDEADPLTIDITWLMKKCEWVCRKINYALALLRYNIIKYFIRFVKTYFLNFD